jgi:hypothetical protein
MAATLEEATAYLQTGDIQKAQDVLARLLRANIRDEQAWFLLAQCVSDPNQRRQCLQRVVSINPGHWLAQSLLNELQSPSLGSASFQPRAFELAGDTQTVNDSFQPREFELADHSEIGAPIAQPAPAFSPRPFDLAEADTDPQALIKGAPTELPTWVRQPNSN